MKCTRVEADSRMYVALSGKLLEEVECFKYLVSLVGVDGGIDGEVKLRGNAVGQVFGGMRKVL